MGWSKGKGLGANEDGSRDFVRVRYKNDIQGLGYEQRDDQWTQHESSFNGLLKSLNGDDRPDENTNNKTQCEQSDDDTPRMGFGFNIEKPEKTKSTNSKLKEKISGISLEERSKQSKARVHYKKFTRGKDLSQYSEKDLANIFGKKAVEEQTAANVDIYQELAKNLAGPNKIERDLQKQETTDNFGGVQTISTGLSVSEYFKMKMAALKNKSHQQQAENDSKGDDEHADNSTKRKKKKCKDKTQKTTDNLENIECDYEQVHQVSQNGLPDIAESGKKKKRIHCTDNVSEEMEQKAEYIENNKEVEEPVKKKKKSKKRKYEEQPATDIESDEKKKSKKNKCKGENSCQMNSWKAEQVGNIMLENDSEAKSDGISNTELTGSKSDDNAKSKKKKKNKNKISTENEGEERSQADGITFTENNVADTYDLELNDSQILTLDTIRQLSLPELKEKLNSYNICQLSTFTAEKFRNVDLSYFPNSTLPQVDGYRYNKDLQLRVEIVKNDERRINNLWSNTLCKYANLEKPIKTYSKYAKQIKIAKQTKQRKPKLHTKTWMRQNAFSLG